MNYKLKYIYTALCVLLIPVVSYARETIQNDSLNKADEKVNILYGQQEYGRFVGNMNVVKGDDLSTYPAVMVNEALAGRLPGVFIRQNSGLPGTDNFTINIRGSMGDYIILVDGVDRALTQYDMEQIDEIRVLKDPVSKAMYGGRLSNGIIMVTTKRGKDMRNQFRMNVHQGIKAPTKLPGYLNAYDFALKYNEALSNDNISVGHYTQEQLEGYKSGNMPYMYPDVDYYNEFLNKTMNITRINAEYYGGNEKTRYYVHGSFQNEGGLEKYGDKKTSVDAFNIQGNLDAHFSDYIKLHSNFAGYIGGRTYPGNFSITTLSSRYPNSYPIFVRGDTLGGTAGWTDNPYAGQARSGYVKENHLQVQGDMGLEFRLDKLIKGLSFKPTYSFDVFHRQNLTKIHQPGIYSISSFDQEGNALTLDEIQVEMLATEQSLRDSDFLNRWAFITTASYSRIFGKHAVDADLFYYISRSSRVNELYDYKRQNLALRANYTFSGKYTVEGVLNYVGSQSYHKDQRFKLFPAIGAGWLISGESFLKNVSAVNFLKLNASWGRMGDGNIDTNLWRETWDGTGSYSFNSSSSAYTTQLRHPQNYTLNWPVQSEMDISIEAQLINSIVTKLTYFGYIQDNLISRRVNTIPSIVGGVYLPYSNYEKNGMRGFEAEISYTKQINEFKFRIGAHATYSKTRKIKVDELDDPLYTTAGTPIDAIWGYRSAGYYTQSEIAEIAAGTNKLPLPSFIDPEALKTGNIKYKDIYQDGTIDKYDMQIIGNSAPRLMYGLDASFDYKGFNLYFMLLGYGQYKTLLSSSYYQIYSTRKYSNVLNDGLPNGNPHPLLTTGAGTNDFQISDYWIANASYLKLQNVALSYSLPMKVIQKLFMQELKFTLYGTDLLTFSRIKDLNPESFESGVTLFPLFTTYALGVSITF